MMWNGLSKSAVRGLGECHVVKSNIGHTEAVSGIAAVIKTVYALKHQLIPAHLNYEKPHPKIPLEEWHLQVSRKLFPSEEDL